MKAGSISWVDIGIMNLIDENSLFVIEFILDGTGNDIIEVAIRVIITKIK